MIEEYKNKIICGDSLEFMRKLPDKCIDLILTDPPYGITDCDWDTIKNFMPELLRVAKEKAPIIVFSRNPYTATLIYENKDCYKHSWVWNKKISGGFATAKFRPLQITEDINVFCKNSPNYYPIMTYQKMRTAGGAVKKNEIQSGLKYQKSFRDEKYPTNLLEYGNTDRKNSLHPTQKPVNLMSYLIQTYSKESDIILDPFLGSGTTAVAAQNLHRNFIVIEISPEYCKIAEKRLRQKPLI